MSYDLKADGPYQHTWWVNDYSGQWEKTVFFPAATNGMDTNTTIEVCIKALVFLILVVIIAYYG